MITGYSIVAVVVPAVLVAVLCARAVLLRLLVRYPAAVDLSSGI